MTEPFDLGAKLTALRTEIQTHPGQRARVAWDALRQMFTVWAANQVELRTVLAAPSQDVDLAIEIVQNVRQSDTADAYQDEIARTLHNYVAATASLIDHGRRHVGSYAGMPFEEQFATRNGAVRDLPESGVVRGLRNYLLHYALPYVGYTARMLGPMPALTGFDYQPQMSTRLLLAFDGWKAVAKAYLSAAGEVINLIDVIDAQAKPLHELYSWVLDQYQVLHRDDTLALNALIDEYNKLMRVGSTS